MYVSRFRCKRRIFLICRSGTFAAAEKKNEKEIYEIGACLCVRERSWWRMNRSQRARSFIYWLIDLKNNRIICDGRKWVRRACVNARGRACGLLPQTITRHYSHLMALVVDRTEPFIKSEQQQQAQFVQNNRAQTKKKNERKIERDRSRFSFWMLRKCECVCSRCINCAMGHWKL